MNWKKIRIISRRLLTIWGGISLLCLMIIIGYLYFWSLGNTNREDKAKKSDVRFVLNRCGLGDQRIDTVLKSYNSARLLLLGDHLDAYAIKITGVTLKELANEDNTTTGWYRMDSLPPILDEAVTFVNRWQNTILWFPEEKRLRTKDFYVFPVSIYIVGLEPNGIELIFINPDEKTVYYFSASM